MQDSSDAISMVLSLLGHANALAELTNRTGGIAATAQTGNGRHTRVIPAFYVFSVTSWFSLRLDITVYSRFRRENSY